MSNHGMSNSAQTKRYSKRITSLCLSISPLLFFLHGFMHHAKGRRTSIESPTSPTNTASSRTFLDVPINYKPSCGDGLWHGTFGALNADSDFTNPSVSIAIAFCDHPLDWLDDLLQGLDVRNITVYSKCGNQVPNILNRTNKVELKNVGRVDHAYAYHMANLPEDTDPDEVQLFLKDTYPNHHQVQLRRRSLQDVIREAAGTTGFSCGSIPNWSNTFDRTTFLSQTWFHTVFNYGSEWSAWHMSSEVAKFSLKKYNSAGGYAARDNVDFAGDLTFEKWFEALKLPMHHPVMPVCYAGTLAAKAKNIFASRTVWSTMLKLLERGDNIIEGHYAERTYAAALMPYLPRQVYEEIIRLSRGFRMCSDTAGFCGLLYGCSDDINEG